MQEEIWKPITGYEGLYEVSDLGRIKSLPRTTKTRLGHTHVTKGGILSLCIGGGGYRHISLYLESVSRIHKVSRLVAAEHIGEIPPRFQVDHINGIVFDNRKDNLRIVTHTRNAISFQRKPEGCSSKFRGVTFNKARGKYKAGISLNKKTHHLGYFKDEYSAAVKWNEKAKELGFSKEALNAL